MGKRNREEQDDQNRHPEPDGYFDWILLAIVTGVGATGMLSWVLRLADMEVGYFVYFLHLVFVWSLFAYAPYSKFAHLFYRTTAMVFARYTGRQK